LQSQTSQFFVSHNRLILSGEHYRKTHLSIVIRTANGFQSGDIHFAAVLLRGKPEKYLRLPGGFSRGMAKNHQDVPKPSRLIHLRHIFGRLHIPLVNSDCERHRATESGFYRQACHIYQYPIGDRFRSRVRINELVFAWFAHW